MPTLDAVIEAWFTATDRDALERLSAELAPHGAQVITAPWNVFGAAPAAPERPWSLVLALPAALDPTLVAATADSCGCRYRPGDGSARWEWSEVQAAAAIRARRRP